MTIRLKVFKDSRPVETKVLEGSVFKIGRMQSCHVRLDDARVSRIHAVIEVAKGCVTLIDLGCGQGTFVNGKKEPKATLQPGDEICIGPFRLVFDPADELEDIGARLAKVRDAAHALVESGKVDDAVELVRREAALAEDEAREYVEGLGAK